MAQALESQHAETGDILFELDSIELGPADRLVVSGRWSGVRGRRFVRPTLTLVADGKRTRLLADLEHKPWAAEDGSPWTAAFPCDDAKIAADELELAVAPDIAVSLPAPGATSAHGAGRRVVKMPPSPPAEPENPLEARLREERARAEDARTELQAALARRDAAVAKLDAVIGERDEASRAAKRARRELEAAERGRDTALRARDAALRDREHALRDREKAMRDRDAAMRERERAIERFRRLRATAQARLAQLQNQVRREPRRPPPVAAAGGHSDWLARGLTLAVFLAVVIALLIVFQSP